MLLVRGSVRVRKWYCNLDNGIGLDRIDIIFLFYYYLGRIIYKFLKIFYYKEAPQNVKKNIRLVK